MSQQLAVTLIQTELVWENAAANLAHFDTLLAELNPGETDLVLFPEMFTTGFSMNVNALAEAPNEQTTQWLAAWAKHLNAAVAGSFIVKEGEQFYNRFVWVEPDGTQGYYNKRHRFGMAGEDKVFSAGEERQIWTWRGWRICPMICYDVRFPVWSRNTPDLNYDLLVYVANFPQRRIAHWNSLLKARAIENQCYVAAVNCVGTDGNGIYYNGDSQVINPLGELSWQLSDKAGRHTAVFTKAELQEIREKMPFLKDQD